MAQKRRKHIARVCALLMQWADEIEIPSEEREAWLLVGRLHDALRDAPESELRARAREGGAVIVVSHRPDAAHGAHAVYTLAGGRLRPH